MVIHCRRAMVDGYTSDWRISRHPRINLLSTHMITHYQTPKRCVTIKAAPITAMPPTWMNGSLPLGGSSPHRMALSARLNRIYPMNVMKLPSTIAMIPVSVWVLEPLPIWVNATPPAMTAKAVLIHASKVRSLASRKRASGSNCSDRVCVEGELT